MTSLYWRHKNCNIIKGHLYVFSTRIRWEPQVRLWLSSCYLFFSLLLSFSSLSLSPMRRSIRDLRTGGHLQDLMFLSHNLWMAQSPPLQTECISRHPSTRQFIVHQSISRHPSAPQFIVHQCNHLQVHRRESHHQNSNRPLPISLGTLQPIYI